jgi:hypothetical protein
LLGLLGFLIPYTSTILTLCQFSGALPPYTLVGLTADYYFFGALAMVLAGIGEFILGNSTLHHLPHDTYCETNTCTAFPFVVFIIYGTHWCSLAYNQDPMTQITSAFTAEGGATGAPYNSSQMFHNITM